VGLAFDDGQLGHRVRSFQRHPRPDTERGGARIGEQDPGAAVATVDEDTGTGRLASTDEDFER